MEENCNLVKREIADISIPAGIFSYLAMSCWAKRKNKFNQEIKTSCKLPLRSSFEHNPTEKTLIHIDWSFLKY